MKLAVYSSVIVSLAVLSSNALAVNTKPIIHAAVAGLAVHSTSAQTTAITKHSVGLSLGTDGRLSGPATATTSSGTIKGTVGGGGNYTASEFTEHYGKGGHQTSTSIGVQVSAGHDPIDVNVMNKTSREVPASTTGQIYLNKNAGQQTSIPTAIQTGAAPRNRPWL